jgi:hypothetical protein
MLSSAGSRSASLMVSLVAPYLPPFVGMNFLAFWCWALDAELWTLSVAVSLAM